MDPAELLDTPETVGEAIREIRKLRQLTLQELADKVGVTQANLSRMENDHVTPRYATIRDIANALEVHPVLLLVNKNPKDCIRMVDYEFYKWHSSLNAIKGTRRDISNPTAPCEVVQAEVVQATDALNLFLKLRPEFQRFKAHLAKYCDMRGIMLVAKSRWYEEVSKVLSA